MHLDFILVDVVFILAIMLGFGLVPILQIRFSSRHVFGLGKKLGPDYWGNLHVDGEPVDKKLSISVYKPAREMNSAYGKKG